MRISAIVTLVGLLTGAVSAGAQSLADVARKEEERRKAVKGSGKVYTNKDLKSAAPPPDQPADAAPAAAPADTQPAASSDATPEKASAGAKAPAKTGDKAADTKPDKGESKGEAYWRARMRALQEQLDQEKTLVEALQSRVNALTSDFVNRDDPAQRAAVAADRQKALAELDRMKKAVVADTKAVTALEEEARRAGVPPGWLR